MAFESTGAFPPSLIPHQKKQALSTNYLSFTGGAGAGDSDTFAQQLRLRDMVIELYLHF